MTEADRAVNALLEDRLRRLPGLRLAGEESPDDPAARRAAARTFLIDPIDGTRASSPPSAALPTRSPWPRAEATAAVVYLPLKARFTPMTRLALPP